MATKAPIASSTLASSPVLSSPAAAVIEPAGGTAAGAGTFPAKVSDTQVTPKPIGKVPAVKNKRLRTGAGAATVAIHGGQEPCPLTGAILTPIVQSTTFVQDGVGGDKGYSYSRCSNPTVSALEKVIGALEDAPPAVCTSTGIGAVTALFFSLLKAGDHIVVGDVIYGGTTRLLQQVLAPLGVRASWVDTSNPENVAKAIEPSTKLVLIETPGNPTLKLTDVAAIAAVTRKAGVPLAVDNTFLTPALLRPLDFGADISIYSTTKYIEGHNATVGGALVSRDEALLARFNLIRKSLGLIQNPLEAWLTLRGIKTLPLRIERHCRSAQQIAEWLEGHERVERVLYPGLASFPQAALARKLHDKGLHGGIISVFLQGGTESALRFVKNVKLCSLAESLGATETMLTHSATMTHADVPRAQREAAGITDALVRISVGLEDPADIIADIDEALRA